MLRLMLTTSGSHLDWGQHRRFQHQTLDITLLSSTYTSISWSMASMFLQMQSSRCSWTMSLTKKQSSLKFPMLRLLFVIWWLSSCWRRTSSLSIIQVSDCLRESWVNHNWDNLIPSDCKSPVLRELQVSKKHWAVIFSMISVEFDDAPENAIWWWLIIDYVPAYLEAYLIADIILIILFTVKVLAIANWLCQWLLRFLDVTMTDVHNVIQCCNNMD